MRKEKINVMADCLACGYGFKVKAATELRPFVRWKVKILLFFFTWLL